MDSSEKLLYLNFLGNLLRVCFVLPKYCSPENASPAVSVLEVPFILLTRYFHPIDSLAYIDAFR